MVKGQKSNSLKAEIPKWKQCILTIQFRIIRHFHKKLELEIKELKENGQRGTRFYEKRSSLERRLREAKNGLRDTLGLKGKL